MLCACYAYFDRRKSILSNAVSTWEMHIFDQLCTTTFQIMQIDYLVYIIYWQLRKTRIIEWNIHSALCGLMLCLQIEPDCRKNGHANKMTSSIICIWWANERRRPRFAFQSDLPREQKIFDLFMQLRDSSCQYDCLSNGKKFVQIYCSEVQFQMKYH